MLRVRQPAIKSQTVFNTYFRIQATTLDEGLMSYPRNVVSPEPLVIGPVVQISDGAVQTAGVSVKVSKDSGAFAAGAGSLSIEEGEWSYLPTQGETDCESLRIILYKTGCYSRNKQVVFSASDLFGYGGTDQSKIANPTAIVGLTNTTVGVVTDVTTKSGYSLSSAGVQAIWDFLTSGILTVGSVGKLVVDRLDATISSRSTYAGGDTPGTSTLVGRLTAQRATNLDFLDAAISSVLSSITGLNNLSAKCNLFGAALLEVPETGSTIYSFDLVVKDDEDKLVNLDAAPTITATNAAGTNRSDNLSSVSSPGTGRYRFTYTVASTHVKESLRIEVSGTVSAETRYAIWNGSVVDYDTTTILQSVQTSVNTLNTKIPYNIDLDGTGRVRLQAIEHSGSIIPIVAVTQELGPNALSAADHLTPIGITVWSMLTTYSWPTNSLGAKVLISEGTHRSVAVTGSHHVAADIHELQPGVINEVHFADNTYSARVLATDAVTEIVTGVWTRDLSTFTGTAAGKTVYDVGIGVSTLLSRVIDGTAALITDLRTMLIGTGTSLVKWTINALSNAPSGGGGQTITATVAVPQLLEQTAFNLQAIVVYRGCFWSFQIQDLGTLSGYSEIWFTLRKQKNDLDSESELQVSLTGGLLIANKTVASNSAHGSLTYLGEDVTIQVSQEVTQYLVPSNNYSYDLKGRNNAGQTIMLHESDKFTIKRDVTRRII